MPTNLQLSQQQKLQQTISARQVRLGRAIEMSAAEFEDEVRRALDENPALEAVDSTDSEAAMSHDDEGVPFNESAEDMQRADYANPDDDMMPTPAAVRTQADYSTDWRERVDADDMASGYEKLETQLADFDLSDTDRNIATYIIGNIDANGRLARSPQDIADDIAIGAGIDVDADRVRRLIDVVRSMEPAGICSYDLRDCLQLQLARMDASRTDVADAAAVIDKHFDDLVNHSYDRIIEAMGIDRKRFDAAMRVIHTLNPKPGASLEPTGSADRMRHITPDFIVDTTDDGKVTVSLTGNIPELAIERSFLIGDKSGKDGGEASAFIKSRREEASEFIDIAHSRSATLMAVMQAIIRLQPEYFATFDISRLRPMVQRDIKDITGFDVSTISRATATKYMLTPEGIVPLKSLFSEGVSTDGATSSTVVKEAVRDIIAGEDPTAPLSDEDIRAALLARGHDVARRTVAKYREMLGIPIARQRRK